MSKVIEMNNFYYKYEKQTDYLLSDINLEVKKGEILAIVGLSGAGKSTLCYSMSGVIPHIYKGVTSGDVRIKGKLIRQMKLCEISTEIGIVFQDPDSQLFSPTVEDELAFGPENLCLPREEIGRRIEKVLDQISMKDSRYDNPNDLSGGQKQLVALGAVLSLDPDILVFDEAMAQIDTFGRKQIKKIITDLKANGKTIVMIEHDFNNLDIADRILLLKDGRLKGFEGEL